MEANNVSGESSLLYLIDYSENVSSWNDSLVRRHGGYNVTWANGSEGWTEAPPGTWPRGGGTGGEDSPYPSGYSQLRIVMTSFFVTIIMILVVVGNMLVCIAIATEKSLKTVQNWFIASLAVSDFLLGLVIMPFSLANEVMGYWIFGRIWCEIHSALDVLLCTASINNLCLISLDRYWSVTQAVEYLKKRTPSRALFMICFVWALSALISLPPLVGWKKKAKESAYPSCDISDDVGYVLYSAFGSFYIPAVVMVFVYIRIFAAARSRARKHVKRRQRQQPEVTNDPVKDKSTTTTTCTSFSNPSPPEKGSCGFPTSPVGADSTVKENGAGGSGTATSTSTTTTSLGAGSLPTPGRPLTVNVVVETTKKRPPSVVLNATPQIIIETPEESSSVSPSPGGMYDYDDEYEETGRSGRTKFFGDKDPKIYHVGQDSLKPERLSPFSGTSQFVGSRDAVNPSSLTEIPTPKTGLLGPDANSKRDFGSVASLTDYERSDLETEDDKEVKIPKKALAQVTYQQEGTNHPVPGRHTASEAERHRRKVAKARERRATLILGLIMGSFILAWLPFFVLYVLEALCSTCYINPTGFAIAFWLGYCNSALNPIIYTIFNRDFRRAFKKILFK